jgi:2-polyprenyl-6-methoxyphenol hydroxylase-like FAD-dependent oxidoreductase
MFPTTGQGACQSLEDAAALGIFLNDLRCKTDLHTRLHMFQTLRSERVMSVHAMSSVLVGQETRMNEKLAKALPGGKLFSGHMEHLDFTNAYVYDHSGWYSELIWKV